MTHIVLGTACVNPNKLPGIRSVAKQQDARISRETDEAIKNSPILQELDKFCAKQLPPELGFVEVSRQLDFGGGTSLSYGYHSEAEFARVKQAYKNWLTPNGWSVTVEEDSGWGPSLLDFRKENYVISIYDLGSGEGVNFKIHCEKSNQ